MATTAAQDLQRLCAASFRAWAGLADAWWASSNAVWAEMVEWAYDEDELGGPNSVVVTIHPSRPCELHATLSYAADPALVVPVEATVLEPSVVGEAEAGGAVKLLVRIQPFDGIRAGVYRGSIVDDKDTVLKESIAVTVMDLD